MHTVEWEGEGVYVILPPMVESGDYTPICLGEHATVGTLRENVRRVMPWVPWMRGYGWRIVRCATVIGVIDGLDRP